MPSFFEIVSLSFLYKFCPTDTLILHSSCNATRAMPARGQCWTIRGRGTALLVQLSIATPHPLDWYLNNMLPGAIISNGVQYRILDTGDHITPEAMFIVRPDVQLFSISQNKVDSTHGFSLRFLIRPKSINIFFSLITQ